jgi:GDPmannose 4,6-dehydratase
MPLEWVGTGQEECGIETKSGRVLVKVDPRYYRPTEVDLLIGNASKARTRIGWEPKMKFESLVRVMAETDLDKVSKRGY